MHKFNYLTLLAALLLGSCAPVQTPSTQPPFGPTQPAPATATQTAVPSRTSLPTQASNAVVTDQMQGPYLLISQDSTFTIMNINGNIRKQIQLPDHVYTATLETAVSPDGNLLAYFTGSTEEPYDLTLNLFNLSDESSQKIVNLIAPGYPENLRPIAETLDLSHYSPSCNTIECLTIASSSDFENGIASFAWSPHGQYLAFAAQIDGPSSDVYLYDVESQDIRRLTDEIGNFWEMEWSPYGEKILYSAVLPGPVDSYRYWYVADTKINSLQSSSVDISYPYSAKLGWITQNSFLYAPWPYVQLPDSPTFDSVRHLNLDDNETKEIWSYGAQSIGLDQVNNKVILSTKGKENSDIELGTYLISLDGSFTKISDTVYKFFEDQEPFNGVFGLALNSQIYFISPDGDIRLLGPGMEYATPSISPNKKWLLVFEDNNKISLYSDGFQLQKSWSFDEHINSSSIKWRPDSLGLILSANGNKYYISIPEGEPQLKAELSNIYESHYVWLP